MSAAPGNDSPAKDEIVTTTSMQLLDQTIWFDPNMPLWCLEAINTLPFETLIEYRQMFNYHFTDSRFYGTLKFLTAKNKDLVHIDDDEDLQEERARNAHRQASFRGQRQ